MRILHILDHSPPHASGYVFRTLAILRGQRALGWDTVQLTTPRQGTSGRPFDDIDGWRFHRTPPARPGFARFAGGTYGAEMAATARRIEELVREYSPDVLHAHSPVLNALPALAVGRRLRLPVVYEMRASWEDAAVDHGSTHDGSLRYRASRALETFALKNAAAVTTICEGLRKEILARGVDPQRVTVIPNAVDVDSFRSAEPSEPALREQLGLADAEVIGFAGSFYGYEGLDIAIEALHLLRDRRPRLRLLLLGGGPQDLALQRQACALALGDRVRFVGRVPHSQMQRYYDLIDVLIYPRRSMRLTELVTPLKPLEAMAQGRLVLASNVGGHRELVRDGETGWLFGADDPRALAGAIDQAFTRRNDWPRVAANAARFVDEERTWSQSIARYADVYAAVCAPRNNAAAVAREA
jgi:PEP-CTERM/exosortase A-associated glycosyltransferase